MQANLSQTEATLIVADYLGIKPDDVEFGGTGDKFVKVRIDDIPSRRLKKLKMLKQTVVDVDTE